MACFMVAFLVICSHVTFRIRYDALGITEPMLTWSLNGSRGEYSGEYVGETDQPITWSTRADGGVAGLAGSPQWGLRGGRLHTKRITY